MERTSVVDATCLAEDSGRVPAGTSRFVVACVGTTTPIGSSRGTSRLVTVRLGTMTPAPRIVGRLCSRSSLGGREGVAAGVSSLPRVRNKTAIMAQEQRARVAMVLIATMRMSRFLWLSLLTGSEGGGGEWGEEGCVLVGGELGGLPWVCDR